MADDSGLMASKLILDCISDGVFTIDAQGHVLSFNRAAETITGFSEGEVLGRPCRHIFQTPLCHTLCPLKRSVQMKETTSNFEIVMTHRNGQRIPISVNTAVLRDAEGNVLGGVETFRDISEVTALRNRLESISRLRSLAVVAAGVAHEIRNPLAVISTNLEHLREKLGTNVTDSDALEDVLIEVARANQIVKRLLDFASPQKTSKVSIDVNELVESVLADLAGRSRENQIRVDRHLTADLPLCDADPGQLRTALANIVVNALEAMPTGGTLVVQTRGQTETLSVDGMRLRPPPIPKDWQFVAVVIQDSGQGIPAAHVAHVFDPFFSLKDEGTGLGLSVSYQIIERHGGMIDLDSEPGAGTRVCVRLPVSESGAP